jgi:hypothetical protein
MVDLDQRSMGGDIRSFQDSQSAQGIKTCSRGTPVEKINEGSLCVRLTEETDELIGKRRRGSSDADA